MNNPTTGKTICIFCSSSADLSEKIRSQSAEFAALLAKEGFSLLYGGTTCGLMKTVADAHKAAGGRLLGVIPRYMIERGIQHPGLDEAFAAEDLRDRKQAMLDHSDVIVALPGGIGTYDEFFDLLAMKQLKRHDRPMFLFNINGYFEPLMAMLRHSIAEKTVKPEHLDMFKISDTADELTQMIKKSFS